MSPSKDTGDLPALELGADLTENLGGRYDIQKTLGRGGMGAVFLAIDRQLGRKVAIKFLCVKPTPILLERFHREARASARLQHPNIVKVYDFGNLPKGPYLVLEFLDGVSLDANPRGLDLVHVAVSMISAIDHLQKGGMVHRDIKPGNIFLTLEGRIVLTDFGLVQDPAQTQLTQSGVVVGSFGFLSPEYLQGAPPSPAQDWWALGVTLYLLGEGHYPFDREQLVNIARGGEIHAVAFERISPQGPLRELIRRLLHPDPELRGSSQEKLAPVLKKFQSNIPSLTSESFSSPESMPLSLSKKNSNWRPWVPLVAVCCLAALFGVLMMSKPLPLLSPPISSPGAGSLAPSRHGNHPINNHLLERLGAEFKSLESVYSSPDPMFEYDIWRAIPTLQEVFHWFFQGGNLESLSAEQRRELEKIDAFFQGQNLGTPLLTFRRVTPLLEEPIELLYPKDLPPPPSMLGWLGHALQAYYRAMLLLEEKERDWNLMVKGKKSAEIPGAIKITSTGKLANFWQLVRTARILPASRGEMSLWLAPIHQQTEMMVYALARSLRHEPENHHWLLPALSSFLHDTGSHLPLRFVLGNASELIGLEPKGPEEWLLVSDIHQAASWMGRGTVAEKRRQIDLGEQALQQAQKAMFSVKSNEVLRAILDHRRLQVLYTKNAYHAYLSLFRSSNADILPLLSLRDCRHLVGFLLAAWKAGQEIPTGEDVAIFKFSLWMAKLDGTKQGGEMQHEFFQLVKKRRNILLER